MPSHSTLVLCQENIKYNFEIETITSPLRNKDTSQNYASKTDRIAAGIIDMAIVCLLIFITYYPRARLMTAFGLRKTITIFLPSAYLLLRDSVGGASIGKRIMKICVYNTQEMEKAGIYDSILRNWYLGIPFIGPTILSMLAFIQILIKNFRSGEMFSNTIVIKNKH